MKPYKYQRVRIKRQLSTIPKRIPAGGIGLTAQMSYTYRLISARMAATGVAPSRRELMEILGLKSPSGVQRIIDGLEERGWIARLPHRCRAIKLLREVS
jgi:SOS-response transcriptional repressor LexA